MKKLLIAACVVSLAAPSMSQDAVKSYKNTYVVNGTQDYAFLAVTKKIDGMWRVSYVGDAESLGRDFRPKIKTQGGEILLVKSLGATSWEFQPYFDITSPNQKFKERINCNKTVPYGMDKNLKFDTTNQTNVCDSPLMTDTDPDTSVAAKVAGSALAAVLTGGLSLAAQAASIGDSRYLDKKEMAKVIEDTRLDELLGLLKADMVAVKSKLLIINKTRGDKAAGIPTSMAITDKSGWLKKPTALDAYANALVRYSVTTPVGMKDVFSELSMSVDAHAAWRQQWTESLSRMDAVQPMVRAQCPLGNTLVGSMYRVTVTCPSTFEYSAQPTTLPVQLTGIDMTVSPTITAADPQIKVSLEGDALRFENLTSEFIEIRDISFSVNGNSFTLSSPSGSSQLTLGPKSLYPRGSERSKFPLSAISDVSMTNAFELRNMTLQAAKESKVTLNLAVRYVTENTTATKTVRSVVKTTLYDMAVSSGKI